MLKCLPILNNDYRRNIKVRMIFKISNLQQKPLHELYNNRDPAILSLIAFKRNVRIFRLLFQVYRTIQALLKSKLCY